MTRRALTTAVFAVLAPAAGLAQNNLVVGTTLSAGFQAGEAQSTVIPPARNSACPAGRFLVTNDGARPPDPVVFSRDPDQWTGGTQSAFDMAGLQGFDTDLNRSRYFFGTNDHDLVTLSNGDVLYLTGAFSRAPLKHDTGWGADTYRTLDFGTWTYDFGPRTRSVVLAFRSQDCGKSFHFLSEMDPDGTDDGSCALPQFRRKEDYSAITSKPWDMGGTDGQLAKVDPATGRIYLTFACVGYRRDAAKAGWVLSETPLNKTLLVVSDDGGASWTSMGYMDGRSPWRFGVVPMAQGTMAYGLGPDVIYGTTAGESAGFTSIEAGPAGWGPAGPKAYANVPQATRDIVAANVWASPVITRTPDPNTVLLAYPGPLPEGYGYHVYLFNHVTGRARMLDAIRPSTPGPGNFVMHLTVADPGQGPVLLYWTDFDGQTATGTVRGRIITSGSAYTADFVVARARGGARTFTVKDTLWFGDYQTASGFAVRSFSRGQRGAIVRPGLLSSFFPMWIEPGGVHYARVDFSSAAPLTLPSATSVPIIEIKDPVWLTRPRVPLARVRRPGGPSVEREPDIREMTPRVRMTTPRGITAGPQ